MRSRGTEPGPIELQPAKARPRTPETTPIRTRPGVVALLTGAGRTGEIFGPSAADPVRVRKRFPKSRRQISRWDGGELPMSTFQVVLSLAHEGATAIVHFGPAAVLLCRACVGSFLGHRHRLRSISRPKPYLASYAVRVFIRVVVLRPITLGQFGRINNRWHDRRVATPRIALTVPQRRPFATSRDLTPGRTRAAGGERLSPRIASLCHETLLRCRLQKI